MGAFEQIGVEAVVKGAAQYKRDIGDVSQSTTQAKSIFSGLGPVIGLAATALGGFLSFKGITGAINKTTELGSSVRTLMRETGLSAEDGSRWTYIFQRFGMTGEDASRTIGIFAKNLKGMADAETGVVPGGKKVSELLKSIGIEALTADGNIRPINELIPELADKFKAMPDGLEKTALSMQIFGKSGKDMIPILNQGSEGLKALSEQADKLGLTLSAENVNQIKKYGLAHKDLDAAMGGLQLQIGLFLMPALTMLVQLFVRALPPIRAFVTDGLDLIEAGFRAVVPWFMVAKSVAEALFGILTSEGGILNVIATDLALAFGVPRGTAGLIGFTSTLKTLLGAVADQARGFLSVGWEILQNAVLPAVTDIARGFGTMLGYLTPLLPVIGQILGFGWGIFASVATWLSESAYAADVLKVAFLGIMGVLVLNTIAGWIYALGSFIGTLASIPAKMAEAAAQSNIGKLFGETLGQGASQVAAEGSRIGTKFAEGIDFGISALAGTIGTTIGNAMKFDEFLKNQVRPMAARMMTTLGTAMVTSQAILQPYITALTLFIQTQFGIGMLPFAAIVIAIIVAAFLIWKYRDQIMAAFSKLGEILKDSVFPPIRTFFTQTLPGAIASFFKPENIGRRLADLFVAALVLMFPPTLAIILYIKFKEHVDAFAMQAGALFVDFVTHTIPDLLADNWKFIVMALFPVTAIGFYREQILAFGQQAGAVLIGLVTDTLPQFIGDHWQEILFAIFPLQMAIIKWREDIRSFGDTAGRAILDFIMGLPTLIGDRWKEIFAGVPAAFAGFVTQIDDGLGTALTTVTDWLTGLEDWLTEHFSPWNWIKQAFVDMYHGFVSELGKIFGSGYVTDWVGRLGAWLTENLNPWNWIKAAFEFFKNAIVTDLNFITGLFSGLPGRIIEALGDLLSLLLQSGKNIVQGLYTGAQAAWDLAWAWLSGIPDSIVRAIPNPLDILKSVGRMVVEGFLSGVRGAWGTVTSFFGGSMDELIAEAERKWESRSPSQVMWRLGKNIGVGLGLGIEAGIKKGLPGIAGATDRITSAVTGGLERMREYVNPILLLLGKQLEIGLGQSAHKTAGSLHELFEESGNLNIIATRLLLILDPSVYGTDAVLGFKNTITTLIAEVQGLGGEIATQLLPTLIHLRNEFEENSSRMAESDASAQWVVNWQTAWDAVSATLEQALADQAAAEAAANTTGLKIGQDLGGAIAEGLDIMVRNLGLEGGLEDLLDKTRSFVTGLHSELNRLLGLPTQQSAQEQLDLAELQLKRFQLETQAAAEAEQRERQLGDLRAQLSAARASENDADVSGIQARIDALEGTMGPAERQIENLDKEIDRIKRLGEERKLQNDIIAAHGLVADKTLLTDQAVTKAGEAWVLVIGDQTEALHNQTGDIWSQYLPAIGALEQSWRDTADAAYDAAQAQIDAAKASQTALLDAAQAQVDLNNARAAGALSEIAYGLQSQTAEGALGRALNNIGGGALLGQFMTKVAGGMSIPAALALFFGPHGAFVNKFGELQTQLLAEGVKLQPDFVTVNLLTDTAGSAAAGVVATTKVGTDTVDALAGGFNSTSAGLDTVAVGVTDGTAAIGTALGVVDLSVGKVYDSIGSVEDGLLTLINIASQIEAHTGDTARVLLSGVGLPTGGGGVGEAPGFEVPNPIGTGEAPGFSLPAWSIPGTPEYDAMKLHDAMKMHDLAKLQTLPSVAFAQSASQGGGAAGVQISFGNISVSGANITTQDVKNATYDGTTAAMKSKGLIPQ